jgi:hypothetical protein
MLVGQEVRTAYWHLREDLEVSVDATRADFDAANLPAIAERYGDLILPSLPEGDAVDQAQSQARRQHRPPAQRARHRDRGHNRSDPRGAAPEPPQPSDI